MKSIKRIYVAATALVALAACMKAGDGLGLDANGRTIPHCQAHPEDPSCTVSTDPCVTAPGSVACSLSLCAKDPTRPGCTVTDCAVTPKAPGCSVNVCLTNPTAPECPPPKTKFAEVYAIMEANSCLNCHVPTGAGVYQGKLNLASSDTAFANLVGIVATFQTSAPGWKRVVPGMPDSSILILKLSAATTSAKLPDGKVYGARMPMGFAALLPTDLAVVRKWIQDGAQK